jgi:hypothetical protein
MNDTLALLQLFNLPNFSYTTDINGVQFRITMQSNNRTQSYFLTVELFDGTVVVNTKEIVDKRQIFTNSNSPFPMCFTLYKKLDGKLTNIRDTHTLSVYY